MQKRKGIPRVFPAAEVPYVLTQVAQANPVPSEALCDAYFALESDYLTAEKHTSQVRVRRVLLFARFFFFC